ncbi:hypothetical protein N7G274_007378 [Stereocaulon virgatum]|uniref:Uncharacterized protein n=1 Tax=Stereocaulon virgatum TaxID=373712 RepID=A0ABR4A4H1_9LECA
MDLPSWQQSVAQVTASAAPPARISFLEAKKFFAVDASGSTAGSIMRAQAQVVRALHSNSKDTVAKWDNRCEDPSLLDSVAANFFDGYGGTAPDAIMRNPRAVDAIQRSDLWVLLTDGEIYDGAVNELTQLAEKVDVIQVPVVLIITGQQFSSPADTKISVGIPFFTSAQEALILFKDYSTGRLTVIDAKGSFAPLKKESTPDFTSWASLPAFATGNAFNERCAELAISITQSDERTGTRAVSLGPEWDTATNNALVDVPALLAEKQIRLEDMRNLLGEEAIQQLSLMCKIRGQLPVLRNLILGHKQSEVIIRLEDRHGAGKIMETLQSGTMKPEEEKQLMEALRKAHSANRETYIELQNNPSEESRRATEINRLIDRAFRIISGLEKSAYTVDILNRKSNRAMRAEKVWDGDSELHLSALDLSEDVKAFRGTCSICCGDEQIMSIVLKRLDSVEENTTDFALNFPLAAGHAKHNSNMVSSQCICFQCALVCPRSIYNEEIVATLPTVAYQGPNKRYINHQLTVAITAGLATGIPGIVQIFMTILDRTLETKAWCSRLSTDLEVSVRRQILLWTLGNLLRGLKCRENFSERTSRMVDYPTALMWAVNDYKEAHLDSWIIQYPVSGFNQLLRWYDSISFPDPETIKAIQQAKLTHLIVTTMMNGLLQQQKSGDTSWTYPFLQVIYQEFNAPGVPRDLGLESLVPAGGFWARLEKALGPWEDVKLFLTSFGRAARRQMGIRIQLVIFWALYQQKGHTMPNTFFATIMSREPLASAALDPEAVISETAARDILLSIFCPVQRSKDKKEAADAKDMDEATLSRKVHDPHSCQEAPPFISPFGPSVLRCGWLKCPVLFYDQSDMESDFDAATTAAKVRDRRTKHLSDIYGVDKTFTSQTGLPEPTQAPKAPTSYHTTLHISTARVWSRLNPERKQNIITPVSPEEGNSAVADFVEDVRFEVAATSHRGNIYLASIDNEVRAILPSLLWALRTASEKLGLEDKSGLAYVYDWRQNTIQAKMEYELSLP